MNNQKKVALVIGATGLVGSHLIEQLLANDEYDGIVALARRSLDVEHPKLHTVITTAERVQQEPDILFNVNHVYCALGTTIKVAGSKEAFRAIDLDYPLAVAERCRKMGADKFMVVSSIGAERGSATFYTNVKGELEHELVVLRYPALHIFRPSLLLGARNEFRFAERIGQITSKWFTPLLIGKMKAHRPIAATVVASAMVKAAMSTKSGPTIHFFHQD